MSREMMTPEEHLLSRYESILASLDKSDPLYLITDALVLRCRALYWGTPGVCNPSRASNLTKNRVEYENSLTLRYLPKRVLSHYRQEISLPYRWQLQAEYRRLEDIWVMDSGDIDYYQGRLKPSQAFRDSAQYLSLSVYHPKERLRLKARIV